MAEPNYVLLPPYDIPGVIVVSGLLVENRTTRPLNNIRIHIEYDPEASRIHHMQIIAGDEYILRGGGETHSFATIRLRQMSAGAQVVVYFAASRPVAPVVSVTSWDGDGLR
jgi:hypothetical protein